MILSPSQLNVDFGKKATFRATIEASLDYPTEGRWQKIQNGVVIKTIDPSEEKYLDTDALYTPQLVINNAEFDDEGEYRLNVRISDRCCSSYNVRLQKVYGGNNLKKTHINLTSHQMNNLKLNNMITIIQCITSLLLKKYRCTNNRI